MRRNSSVRVECGVLLVSMDQQTIRNGSSTRLHSTTSRGRAFAERIQKITWNVK